jgi:murein tripeptide amidase MpaA
MFVFMIVPMINVDGVFHGHFRMDNFGKNLNRYYIDPDFEKQPAIYAIK